VNDGAVRVRVEGEFALFTRPEMKVERVSYEVITPSAARGVLEAVLWKPQMRWVVTRLVVLRAPRFTNLRRNEVGSKVSSDFTSWAKKNSGGDAFFADDDRQQRNALVLRNVAYVIDAQVTLTARAGPEDSVVKYVEMFRRRVEKGQHFQQPYLGCREFPATVSACGPDEQPDADVVSGGEVDLGWMLHDIDYAEPRRAARFFHAVMRAGVIEVPPLESAAVGGVS
jgi:CRISPR-associated protein Cas5d